MTTSPSEIFTIYLSKEDGEIHMSIDVIDGDAFLVSRGWRTYSAALDYAARICADPDGDHSQETIDRTGG